MFERFTDRARRAVVLAQDAVRHTGWATIEPEHLLLGLLDDALGLAPIIGISYDDALAVFERHDETPVGHIPFTAAAKRIMELSLREALQLGHNYIGAEHLALALESGSALQLLEKAGADIAGLRKRIIASLSVASPETSTERELLAFHKGCSHCRGHKTQ